MKGYWLNHYFPKMLADSIAQMPSVETTTRAMVKVGMKLLLTEPYFVQQDLKDHFLYCGKERPELYLREDIRRGISSFSDLAIREEVNQGLQKLALDLANHRIEKVMQTYHNTTGDYLFLVADKPASSRN
jgi:hypothetical protein